MELTTIITYNTSTSFSINAELIQFTNTSAQLADLTDALGTNASAAFHASYDSNANANWADSVTLGGTLNDDATITSGRLDLTGGTATCDYVPTGTINGRAGAIRFTYRPNYSGNPATIQHLFSFQQGNSSSGSDLNDQLYITHDAAKAWRITFRSGVGAAAGVNLGMGSNSLTAGVDYECEINWKPHTMSAGGSCSLNCSCH